MRLNKYHVGRIRIKAAKILAKQFPEWDVLPEDISPASGRNRTDWRLDIYRWELFTRTKTGLPIVLGSYDKLTVFVANAKYGIQHDGHEIWAKAKPKES